jgi:hypothetical protein
MLSCFRGMLFSLFVPVVSHAALASQTIDDLLIRRDARDVTKDTEPEQDQISYVVELKYPESAINASTLDKVHSLGWSKCKRPSSTDDWFSYVDSAQGKGPPHSVFQRLFYFYKDGTVLNIALTYYASVGKDRRCLDFPDNTKQRVVILKIRNPTAKEFLELTCD